MSIRTADQIRSEFLEFFKGKGHTIVHSSPVVPHDDPTLMFANAGMNQFKPIFLGQQAPDVDKWAGVIPGMATRAADTQKCIRAGGKHNDLDDVGHDTYHHTFFEMLGNWSFGDYFKKEAIEWAWELLTKVWGIDPKRLHATYFQGDPAEGLEPDSEAAELWRTRTNIESSHIHPGNKKDNFWEMGDTGPCGPCSEIHIDLTPDMSGSALVNKGDARVMEIWNLVFIQYNRGGDGKLTPLPARHVDTGMGFERITAVLQHKKSNYDTDVFAPIFAGIQRVTNAPAYTGLLEPQGEANGARSASEGLTDRSAVMKDIAYRVIADHIRTLTFALTDGAVPSNEGRGYVLRRILRRAVRYGRQYLNVHEPFLCKLAQVVVDAMGHAFPELKSKPQRVADTIRDEEESFIKTLDRGIALFEDEYRRALSTAKCKPTVAGKSCYAAVTIEKATGKWSLSITEEYGSNAQPTRIYAPSQLTPDVLAGLFESPPSISGEGAFRLHDTYGFPIDLTEVMARERCVIVDTAKYESLMEEAKQRARGTSLNSVSSAISDVISTGFGDSIVQGRVPKTEFVGYETLRSEAKITMIVVTGRAGDLGLNLPETSHQEPFHSPTPGEGFGRPIYEGQRGFVTLDKTPFYAEKGGQIGDRGFIKTSTGRFDVENTKEIQGFILHYGVCSAGFIVPFNLDQAKQRGTFTGRGLSGLEPHQWEQMPQEFRDKAELVAEDLSRESRAYSEFVEAFVDESRFRTMNNHSVTHVLNWALREVLEFGGEGKVDQKGSLVDPDKTRFDFSHNKALTPEEVSKIESLVSDQIKKNLTVYTKEVPQADARKINSLRAVFGEKYPDRVRVVSIGADIDKMIADPQNPEWMRYSVEFCGGTHVKSTSEIGPFALIAEESVAKGVRRVVGVTGEKAINAVVAGKELIAQTGRIMHGPPEQVPTGIADLQKKLSETEITLRDRARIRSLIAEMQEIAKQQSKQQARVASGAMKEVQQKLLDGAERVNGHAIIVGQAPEAPVEQVREAIDWLRTQATSAAVCLGFEWEGKPVLLAAMTDDLIAKGLKAGDLIKAIVPAIDGRGGGKPNFAQAGGNKTEGVPDALEAAKTWIRQKIG